MAMTKREQAKLRSFRTRAQRIEKNGRDLAKDVGNELKRQMKKS